MRKNRLLFAGIAVLIILGSMSVILKNQVGTYEFSAGEINPIKNVNFEISEETPSPLQELGEVFRGLGEIDWEELSATSTATSSEEGESIKEATSTATSMEGEVPVATTTKYIE